MHKKSLGFTQASISPQKSVLLEYNKETKKNDTHKNVIDGRTMFRGCMWKSSMIDSLRRISGR